MNPRRFTALMLLSLCFALPASPMRAQEKPAAATEPTKPAKPDIPEPRAKNGKKLLRSLDLMKLAGVAAPRISPDGSRVAYTVSEVKMEKDKEWKTVTQVWVIPTAGGKAMQYTRGDKSSTAPEWSPDGKMLGFLSDREKASVEANTQASGSFEP